MGKALFDLRVGFDWDMGCTTGSLVPMGLLVLDGTTRPVEPPIRLLEMFCQNEWGLLVPSACQLPSFGQLNNQKIDMLTCVHIHKDVTL